MNKLAIVAAAALTAATFGARRDCAGHDGVDFAKADANKDGIVSWEEALVVYPTLDARSCSSRPTPMPTAASMKPSSRRSSADCRLDADVDGDDRALVVLQLSKLTARIVKAALQGGFCVWTIQRPGP